MLLKFALILGVDFMENITFDGICPKNLVTSLSGAGHVSESGRSAGKDRIPSRSQLNQWSDGRAQPKGGKSCNGKRKTRFTSDLSTNNEEEENLLLSSSSDQLDGNVCGRRSRFDPADKSAVSATRSASSSSTSSSSTSCNGRSAGNGGENGCSGESSGTESENENLAEDNGHLPHAMDRDRDPAYSPRRSGDGISERPADTLSPNNSCDRRHQTCSCCCHKHSAGQSFWCSDPDAAQYQTGAFAHFSVTSPHPATASTFADYGSMLTRLHGFQFDVVLGADGRRNTLADHFPRKEFRGRLAIAITANFVNTHTLTEAQIPEISGISFIYNQQLFRYVVRPFSCFHSFHLHAHARPVVSFPIYVFLKLSVTGENSNAFKGPVALPFTWRHDFGSYKRRGGSNKI